MSNALVAEGIRKTFGGLVALDDVSVSLEKDLMTILIGPNGSGKTTLLNCLTGFYRPDKGKSRFSEKTLLVGLPIRYMKRDLSGLFRFQSPFKNLLSGESATAYRAILEKAFLKRYQKILGQRREESN